jgi:hypothetical protein
MQNTTYAGMDNAAWSATQDEFIKDDIPSNLALPLLLEWIDKSNVHGLSIIIF